MSTALHRMSFPQDLTDLVSILSNPDLAVELRRSAAEQLLALSGEPTLLPSLSSPHVLATALRSAAAAAGLSSLHSPSITSSSNPQDRGSQPRSDLDLGPDLDPDSSWRFCGGSLSSSLAQGGLEPPALDVLSSLDVQLPMACMNLLYAVAARSVGAREWLMTQGGPPDLKIPRPCILSPGHACLDTSARRQAAACTDRVHTVFVWDWVPPRRTAGHRICAAAGSVGRFRDAALKHTAQSGRSRK